ncbi:hypothetical protein SAMN05720468_10413 [Fibrobacter sp. UWEL]|nr:hypothetical protein SAMN05720468_10413 [Fibrobacter sp. UWEL]
MIAWVSFSGSNRFQFTHPRGVRCPPFRCSGKCRCFNSRTHAGCDDNLRSISPRVWVSIHAPTRGAIKKWMPHPRRCRFQFTHPRGVRCSMLRNWSPNTVSIHAPTRGAIPRCCLFQKHTCFNSRTHAGCDVGAMSERRTLLFQFTHPRGVRSGDTAADCEYDGFNSRTHAGCDC